MQFIKSSFWSVLAVGIKSISSLIINKLIANYYGATGIALLAHFQNFIGIFLAIPGDGLNMGVIKYLADKNITMEEYRKIFSAGLILNFIYFIIAIAGLLVFQSYFIHIFAGNWESGYWFIIVAVSIILQLINYFFLAVILSSQKIKIYAILNIISNVGSCLLIYFVANGENLPSTLLAVATGPAVFFFASIYFAVKNKNLKFITTDIRKDLRNFRLLGQFIVMAASTMIFGKLVDFIIRQYAIDTYGLNLTGLWQAVVKLSDLYSAAFVAIVGTVYYPRISYLINHEEELRKYVKTVLFICTPIIFIGLLAVFFFKEEFLFLFFQSDFTKAAYLVDFQLLGDVFKLTSFLLSYLIFAQARTVMYISSQAASAIIYIGLLFFCSNYWGLEGLPIAHAIRYVLYLLFLGLLYRKILFA
jgi:PST family polysaccharide transporter